MFPLVTIGLGFLGATLSTVKDNKINHVAVIDESQISNRVSLPKFSNIEFVFINESVDSAKVKVVKKKYDALLHIPQSVSSDDKNYTVTCFTDEKSNSELRSNIRETIEKQLRKQKIAQLGLDDKKISELDPRVKVNIEQCSLTNNEANNSNISGNVAKGIGITMGFLLFFFNFFSGAMIFQSVMEEKKSRMVELMVTSVKPVELMFGKILGVGAVAFTQIFLMLFVFGVLATSSAQFLGKAQSKTQQMISSGGSDLPKPELLMGNISQLLTELQHQNWFFIIPCCLLFFVLGFLMFSTIYAALGSTVGEDEGEGQPLIAPVLMLSVGSLYIMFAAANAPNSNFAIWASIFPLFSPVVMPARLAFNPPMWQIALSLVFLAATVYAFVWLSGRIFRIGILMYGKKPTLKEIGKWMTLKEI